MLDSNSKEYENFCIRAIQAVFSNEELERIGDTDISISFIESYEDYYIFDINGVEVGILKKNLAEKL